VPFYAEEEKMAETFRQRWILKRHTRQSVHPDTQAGEFTTIWTFSLSGLALFFYAIGQGLLGDAGYVTALSFCFNEAASDADRARRTWPTSFALLVLFSLRAA
jgi:hypothetical protein